MPTAHPWERPKSAWPRDSWAATRTCCFACRKTPWHTAAAPRSAAARPKSSGGRFFAEYTKAHPASADEWINAITGFPAARWDKDVAAFKPEDGAVATRAASGKALIRPGRPRPDPDGRIGRPGAQQQHLPQKISRISKRRLPGPQHPLRRARTCHGGHHVRHVSARRHPALRRHLPGLSPITCARPSAWRP
jgi:hypothetical protein